MCSGSLATERLERQQSLLRRGSPASDIRAVAVRQGRTRDTTRHGKDNAAERAHGGALVSLGHSELALRRGDMHGGDDGIRQRTLTLARLGL